MPKVFVSTKPAELLLLKGEPSYLLVNGTSDLLWVQNTDSDVFRMGKTGPVYYLVAGRWFSAPGFNGPWTFATHQAARGLQEDPARASAFARARLGAWHGAGGGSGAARAGAADRAREQEGSEGARGRRIRAIRSSSRFRTTSVARAVNTDKDIIKVGDLYYMCFQGVWFMAAAAAGPMGSHRHGAEGDLRDPGQLTRRTT